MFLLKKNRMYANCGHRISERSIGILSPLFSETSIKTSCNKTLQSKTFKTSRLRLQNKNKSTSIVLN